MVLTTPKAILFGFAMIALAIASIPITSKIVKPAYASMTEQDVRNTVEGWCRVSKSSLRIYCDKRR